VSPLSEKPPDCPLFDQRNCVQRIWNALQGLLLGPRFQLVQLQDGRWIFEPFIPNDEDDLAPTPWVELVVGPSGTTLGSVLLGLIGLIPDLKPGARWFSVTILLLIVVLGIIYGQQRSELLRIAQEQLRRREQQRTDAAADGAEKRTTARFDEIEDRIDQASQQAAQQSVFSGLAVLQALSNSSDPEVARAAIYFAGILKETASEQIELISKDTEQSIDRQFNQLSIEVAKKAVLKLLLSESDLSGGELQVRSELGQTSLLDALVQLDGQGLVRVVINPAAIGVARYSYIQLTEAGQVAARQLGMA
jgi:DNA-binding MarR family transcriptional regulator